ncbi:uncharacterized protein LOC120635374 [Pararge aegeria]|uniref:uncharacterized protein LOC120635374 n=1 Tax=Pararge aegeria TaxID=116150 RepID=UPI0019D1DBD8|nr:uncharacterized protein LOC120635374 [Pararge aegeria]
MPASKRNSGDATKKMEDGHRPRPMKNMKPSEKKPNSADQFWEEHQAEYEKRGKQSNRVDWVENHNRAYPQLRDELQKRRSTTQCHPEELLKAGCASHQSEGSHHSVALSSKSHNSHQEDRSWRTDSLNSPSSIATLSSYQSYGTINQEPMIGRR